MKLADITPVFTRKNSLQKVNYRPGSALPSISKVFQKLMQKQLIGYIDNDLSSYLCGYRKDFIHSTLYCHLFLIFRKMELPSSSTKRVFIFSYISGKRNPSKVFSTSGNGNSIFYILGNGTFESKAKNEKKNLVGYIEKCYEMRKNTSL